MNSRYLIDTCVFIWSILGDNHSISLNAKKIIDSAENEIVLSTSSIWEMAIKMSYDKLKLPGSLRELIADKLSVDNLEILTISWHHACAVKELPLHHRDPFDRMLIAQALEEDLPIITSDKNFKKYGVKVIW